MGLQLNPASEDALRLSRMGPASWVTLTLACFAQISGWQATACYLLSSGKLCDYVIHCLSPAWSMSLRENVFFLTLGGTFQSLPAREAPQPTGRTFGIRPTRLAWQLFPLVEGPCLPELVFGLGEVSTPLPQGG